MHKSLPRSLLKDLGVLKDCSISSLAGNANDNFIVSDSIKKIVVKRLQEHTSENEEIEAQYRKRLNDNGLPVSSFYVFSSGGFVFTDKDDDYVAMDFVDGETVSTIDLSLLTQLATILAKSHTVDTEGLPSRFNWFNKQYIKQSLDKIDNSYGAKADFEKIATNLPDYWSGEIPTGIVHGDLHGGNIVVNDSGDIVSIIDWEETGIEPLILDIAVALRFLALSKGKWNISYVDAFIEAYEKIRKITDKERSLLHDALKYSSAIESVWAHVKHSEGLMNDDKFNRFVDGYRKEISELEI